MITCFRSRLPFNKRSIRLADVVDLDDLLLPGQENQGTIVEILDGHLVLEDVTEIFVDRDHSTLKTMHHDFPHGTVSEVKPVAFKKFL